MRNSKILSKIDFWIILDLVLIALALCWINYGNFDIEVQNYLFDFESKSWLVDKNEPVKKFIFYKLPKILFGVAVVGCLVGAIFGFRDSKQILKQVQDDNALALRYSNSQLSLHRHPELASGSIHFALTTSSNNAYQASEILLATSFKQSNLPFDLPSENLVKKLWDQDSQQFHQQIFTNETICLIGSGLTAVDVIVGLKKKNFSGKIFVISRRGNFPKKHFAQHQPSHHFIAPQDSKKGLLFLCLKIRNFLRQNPQFDLRHVIDSVLYSTVELWQNFDEKNKKLFLRLLPYWNIFRHRAPISSVELIEEMIASGQIEIKKKGVKKISEKDGKILIETRGEEIECDYAVNCLGFEFKLEKYPLLAQMVDAGLLKKDLFLAQSNHPQVRLLGGLNVGRDFECTAVPDLRLSVESLF